MKKLIMAAVLAAGTLANGSAQAAILEFNVGGILGPVGTLLGTFQLDTASQAISDIDVTGLPQLGSADYLSTSGAYGAVVHDGTGAAPFDFTQIELYADATQATLIKLEIFGFNTVMPGLAVGETDSFGITGFEIVSLVGSRAFIDPTIAVTRLADPALNAVPLPAGLPLLLAGLGAFGLAGRRRRRN